MIPGNFVASLAAFLNVNNIVIKLDQESADFDLANATLLCALTHDVMIEIWNEAADKNKCTFTENTLILDSSSKSSVQDTNYPTNCFADNIFWLAVSNDYIPANLRLDSNYYTLKTTNASLTVEEHYQIKKRVCSNVLGEWNMDSGLDIPLKSKWERRNDLAGVQLHLTTMIQKRFVNEVENESHTGYIPDIVKMMEQKYNFSTYWTLPKDNKYGTPIGNGSYNGVIGMLQRQETDMGAAPFSVTLERSQVISYSYPIVETYSTLIVAHPSLYEKSEAVNMDAFLSVFTPTSWLSVLVMYCVLTFASFAIYIVKHLKEKKTCKGSFTESVIKCVKFSYCTLLKLGISEDFIYSSGKILVIVSGHMSIVIFAYYEGTLTSYLTAKPPSQKLTSIVDTIEQGYTVILLDGSKHAGEIENAPPGSAKYEVYQKLIKGNPDVYYDSQVELIEAIASSPKVALFGPDIVFADPRLYSLKGLTEAEVTHVSMTFQKNSEFRDFFNYNLYKMEQGGVLQFLENKWLNRRKPFDDTSCNQVDDVSALGFSSTGFLTTVLCSGIAAAPAILVMEWVWKLWKNKVVYL